VANHGKHVSTVDEKTQLHEAGGAIFFPAVVLGLIGLGVAVFLGFFQADEAGFSKARFYHAYLVSYAFCLSLSMGGLFFMLIQYLVKAGWSVNVRRIFENLAACIPLMALLSLPIVYSAVENKGLLYPWAVPHHAGKDKAEPHAMSVESPLLASADTEAAKGHAAEVLADAKHADASQGKHGQGEHKSELPGYHTKHGYYKFDDFTKAKQPWLSSGFFVVRIVAYFLILWLIARHFYSASRKQDQTGDHAVTARLTKLAAPCTVIFAVAFTFLAFDLLMSLDHHWYSTMYGVYYFAGSMIATFATAIVALNLLQRGGFLTKSVTTEHFHDLGKFMFAFTFFWAYVAFSQYMLQWYSSNPESTPWWLRRGVTSSHSTEFGPLNEQFGTWSLILLIVHLIIPFPYLLSRHIKRSREALLVGAVWMMMAHWVDLFWLVMPELNNGQFVFGFLEIACAVGLFGLFVAALVTIMRRHPLRPLRDPRQPESMGFVNM
jgi:hypothetical protein